MLTPRHQPAEAPPLTSHLRAHLLAQYRIDLRHDERELDQLTRLANDERHTTRRAEERRRTYRIGVLLLRATATREAIAELDGRA